MTPLVVHIITTNDQHAILSYRDFLEAGMVRVLMPRCLVACTASPIAPFLARFLGFYQLALLVATRSRSHAMLCSFVCFSPRSLVCVCLMALSFAFPYADLIIVSTQFFQNPTFYQRCNELIQILL